MSIIMILMCVVVGVMGPDSLLGNIMWQVLLSVLVHMHGKHVWLICIVVALHVPCCVLLSLYMAST